MKDLIEERKKNEGSEEADSWLFWLGQLGRWRKKVLVTLNVNTTSVTI